MIMPPCKKNGVECDKRYPGCSGECAEYKAWKEHLTAERRALRKDYVVNDFFKDVGHKLRRRRHTRK